ncbi:MAG: PQQ-binding-like beta-propeller repeat protein, partial [Verrucomicrobiae bacterium]|nr:PQQ-binding-like beta-propeller repeat protein [Verrucomicrobiae bacterium]
EIGAEIPQSAAARSRTGRYLVHVLDTDAQTVAKARETLRSLGVYGLASAETLDTATKRLPYSENVVNAIVVRKADVVPAAELFRVLTPGGAAIFENGVNPGDLDAAGFEKGAIRASTGELVARKPRPRAMDAWSHPRHAANGNPVSDDTAVGPPERVRWVAAATSEVEGLVTAGGRNFYGGVLARDSFNGLRLWHRDLSDGKLNDTGFVHPRLSPDRARPIASDGALFATMGGEFVALDAATGEVKREFAGVAEPNEILNLGDVVIATDNEQVRAFDAGTGETRWRFVAAEPKNLVAGGDIVSFLHGRPKRGEKTESVALDLQIGKVLWRSTEFPWLDQVTRTVLYQDHLAFEVSSLSDHDAGNALHLFSAETGAPIWEKAFAPGMNHMRQARAMFHGDNLWILHGGRTNTADKDKAGREPTEVSSLDPSTGQTKETFPAGLTHCFPPVATPNYVFAGVLDMTDLKSGEIVANRITKANCSRENGWVPANGLIYTTPKHCTCWPMLRGFVAMAPALPAAEDPAKQPVESLAFPVSKGAAAAPKPDAAAPDANDWPQYRADRWRSGSAPGAGPESLATLWKTSLGADPAWNGPIQSDWSENPFIKGPLSPPTVANGRVYVARPDAQEVVALDAATGEPVWRFTARGRVDLPPTIHAGLCLFGCHAGHVYALDAATGERVWEMRAAPADARIVAYGQVESPWPVAGSVLAMGDTAYFAAGRQELADGGVLVFAIDPLTGARKWVHRLDEIPHKNENPSEDPYGGFYENSGLEFDPVDILHAEGDRLAMSRWRFSLDGQSVEVDKWNAFAKLDTGGGGGGVWAPRGSWTYGARHQHRFRGEAAFRPLAVFRDGREFSSLDGGTELFRRDFDAAGLAAFDSKWITGWKAAQEGGKGGKPYRNYRIAEGAAWKSDPFTPAGEPAKEIPAGAQLSNDLHALAYAAGNDRLYVIHKDGRLKMLAAADAKVLAEQAVPAPVWDGLAVANGRLYLATEAGEVLCLGAP